MSISSLSAFDFDSAHQIRCRTPFRPFPIRDAVCSFADLFHPSSYHMQYAHGISPVTALPFSPPVAFRVIKRTPNHKNEKHELLEGKCHRCQEWAPVEGVKCVEAKVRF